MGKSGKKHRVTGFSLPFVGGGVSWDTRAGEKEIVRDLVIDLQAKRTLSAASDHLGSQHVRISMLDARGLLSDAMKRLPDESESYRRVREMRDACNWYLNEIDKPAGVGTPHVEALAGVRRMFRLQLEWLADELDLQQAHEFAAGIPRRG